MMQIAAYGHLGGDPKRIETSSGKAMAVASVAVDIAERGVEDPPPEWLGIVAFGGQADKLLQHAKGECLSVSGRVQRNRWQGRDGNEHEQLQVVVDSLVSARTVRPGGKRRQEPVGTDGRSATDAMAVVTSGGEGRRGGRASAPPTSNDEPFNDNIPF